MRIRSLRRFIVLALAALAGAAGLSKSRADSPSGGEAEGPVPVSLPARAALVRAQYADSLQRAGIDGASLERWNDAAKVAVSGGVAVEPPYVEVGRFAPDRPQALGYRMHLNAGDRLRLDLRLDIGTTLFLDLLDPGRAAAPPLAALAAPGVLEYEAKRDGEVVAILQPPVDAGAEYTFTITRSTALVFPVRDRARARILSHFFEPRDGGARRHRGVDIHAPKGSPVVATTDGLVARVEDTPAGGRVVWLRDARGDREYYYAHLDRQLVRAGTRVKAGEVLGTVGNTGNARESSPHLHFGVYRNGVELDPEHFIDGGDERAAERTQLATALVGTTARTRLPGAALRQRSDASGRATTLPQRSGFEVLAAAGRFYRVRRADGSEGFVAGWLVEPAPRKSAGGASK